MKDHKLLIVPILKSLSIHRKMGYKRIIQNKLFKYGVKIKNINKTPFPKAKIKNIKLHSIEEKDCVLSSDKEFEVKNLNPEESLTLWLDSDACPFSGSVWLGFEINNLKNEKIRTYQLTSTGTHSEWPQENKWQDLIKIKDEHTLQQEATNILLIILTIILVLNTLIL